MGAPWGLLGAPGPSWRSPGASPGLPEASWGLPGAFWELLGLPGGLLVPFTGLPSADGWCQNSSIALRSVACVFAIKNQETMGGVKIARPHFDR